MTLISCCPLPNYIFTLRWALFIRILAGVPVRFTMKQKLQASTSVYKCLKVSTKFS